MAAEMTEAGVFTTPGHDGQPQSTVVRAGLDRERALVNTTLERQKGRNLLGNPKASLLVVDPATPPGSSRSAATPNSSPRAPANTSTR
jgi:hypothetical protein